MANEHYSGHFGVGPWKFPHNFGGNIRRDKSVRTGEDPNGPISLFENTIFTSRVKKLKPPREVKVRGNTVKYGGSLGK